MGEWDNLADMSDISLDEQLQKMRDDWDQRARQNARYYVNTATMEWTDEEFFASGEGTVAEQILNDAWNICQGKPPAEMRVLEIGCGAGRVTRALANQFGEVHAVDVSGEMVRQAALALRDRPNAFRVPEQWQGLDGGAVVALRLRVFFDRFSAYP